MLIFSYSDYLFIIIKYLSLIVPILLAVAFLTLLERKILGGIQRREGPNVVGFFGLLQPFADALKLLIKETVLPSVSNKFLFFAAPIISFSLSLITWLVLPFGYNQVMVDLNIGFLYIFAISSLSVYGLILAGWASNSRYAFLGALRSTAQMISYEISIGIILMTIIVPVGSLNLTDIVIFQGDVVWFIIPYFPSFLLFLISVVAETNRAPFDLPEAEAELVSGYNVEYSAAGFALFFIAEYANIIFMSSLVVIFFLGGWTFPFLGELNNNFFIGAFIFIFKLFLVLFFFVWIRAAFPRYRYDQLMNLGWKWFLPLSLSFLFFNISVLYFFDGLPKIF